MKSLLLLALATSTALAQPKKPVNLTWIGPVDPDGPVDAIKLAGNVLVWSDATFFLDADANGPRVQVAKLASARRDHVGQAVPMKVLGTSGEFVEVEPTTGTDCVWTKLLPPDDLAKLRLFVKRSDIAPVVIKPFTKTWPDGTRIEVKPGLPVIAMKPQGYRVAVGDVWLTAALPADAIGYSYKAGGITRPKGQRHKFLVKPTKLALGDLTAESTEPFGVPAVTKKGDNALASLATTCVAATFSVSASAVEDGSIGHGSGSGSGGIKQPMAGERWVLTKGTPLFAPGGKRKVAEVGVRELEVGKPDGKPEACILRNVAFEYEYPPARALPKSQKPKLMLCTPVANVKHVNDAPARP